MYLTNNFFPIPSKYCDCEIIKSLRTNKYLIDMFNNVFIYKKSVEIISNNAHFIIYIFIRTS